jgi:prephenate dehydrogenase
VLTDVGSVKRSVVAAAARCQPRDGVAFVGAHPMAGSERSGFAASDARLFEGRLTLVTPTEASPDEAVTRVTAFWEALGSHVRLISPEAHDRAVAVVSHLVHLAAYGLVAVAEGEGLELAGRGFADTTRVAASPETLWADIVRANRDAMLEALGRYRHLLAKWEDLIRRGDWPGLEAVFARARQAREKLS